MPGFRIFVSSPADVGAERRIAGRVFERLQGKYRAALTLEPVFWEHEPVRATTTFQEQIVSPAECDLVVCILWSRLGTRLPGEFRRADGSRYESGTAFEFETARAAYERHGRPDLLVYRKAAQPLVDVRDREERERAGARWDQLEAYLDEWFRHPDGTFKAGFTRFERGDEFEELFARHVDRLLADRVALGEGPTAELAATPTWLEGSPFRGLEVFEPEHEKIFQGRGRAIEEVTLRLTRRAHEGRAFLLIHGMSGSGKSSLARAGVLPALTSPGVVEGVGLWRRAILKPSQGADPIRVLLDALSAPAALPELAAGDLTPEELEAVAAADPQRLVASVRAALDRAARALERDEGLAAAPAARLALLVDQLEELFTEERIDPQRRTRFVELLDALAAGGRVWVLATMRSDLAHHCAEVPLLVRLKDGLGSYELLPPERAEISQIIRHPAQAAGLRFEEDARRGRLDEEILEAAARDPASLPLLEFTLDALYQRREEGGLLTYAAYDELGELEGAIARRAEEVLGRLPLSVQEALPEVLLALVRVRHDEGTITARTARRAEVGAAPAGAELVAALLAARLLVADGEGNDATLRVAHESLFESWPRAAAIVKENRDDLVARDRVRLSAATWSDEGRDSDLLLPRGRRLSEATDLLDKHPGWFGSAGEDPVTAYVEASRCADRRRRRTVRFSIAAALTTLVVLLAAATWQWRIALRQTGLALSRQLATASANALTAEDRQLALVLAVEAMRRSDTEEARAALARGLEATPLLERTLWLPGAGDYGAAFSPDGSRLAVYPRRRSGDDRRVTIFDPETGRVAATRELPVAIDVLAWGRVLVGAAVGREESHLLVLSDDGGAERLALPEECREARRLGADLEGAITITCYSSVMRARRGERGWLVEPLGIRSASNGALSGDGQQVLSFLGNEAVLNGPERSRPVTFDVAGTRMPGAVHAAVDAGGTRVAAQWKDDVAIWALEGPREPLASVRAPQDLSDLVLTDDGRRLALVSASGRVEVFATGALRSLGEPLGRDRVPTAVASSPDRGWLAAGDASGLVVRLGSGSGAAADRAPLNGWPASLVRPLFLPPPGAAAGAAESAAVVAVEEKRPVVRLIETGEVLIRGEELAGDLLEVASSPAGDVFTVEKTSSAGRSVRRYDPVTGRPTPIAKLGSVPGGNLSDAHAFDADGRILAFTDRSHPPPGLHVLDLGSGSQQAIPGAKQGIMALSAVSDYLEVATDGTIVAGRAGKMVENPLVAWPLEDPPVLLWNGVMRYDDLLAVTVSPAGDRVAAAFGALRRGEVAVWTREGGEWHEREPRITDLGDITALAFHPDGESLAFLEAAGEVGLMRLADSEVRRFAGRPLYLRFRDSNGRLTFDRAGERLAASTARDLRLWNVATGEVLGVHDNPLAAGVDRLLFEDGGRRLAAAARRGPVVRWALDGERPRRLELEEDAELPEPEPCAGPVGSPALDLDLAPGAALAGCAAMTDAAGQRLQLGLRDSWAVLWEVPDGDWLERACRLAGRSLTKDEWQRHVGEAAAYRPTCP